MQKNGLFKIADEVVRVLKHSGKLVIIQRLSIENRLANIHPYDMVLKYLKRKPEFINWVEIDLNPPEISFSQANQQRQISAIKK